MYIYFLILCLQSRVLLCFTVCLVAGNFHIYTGFMFLLNSKIARRFRNIVAIWLFIGSYCPFRFLAICIDLTTLGNCVCSQQLEIIELSIGHLQ